MPIYDANAELRPWAAATDNLSRAMLQLPALRAQLSRQREQAAMESQVNQARIASLNAGADYDRARTAGETQDQGGDMQISKALRLLQVNPNDTNAAADLMEGVGKSFRHNPKQTSEAVGMLMSAILARQGSTNYAQQGALQGDAASIANNLANIQSREKTGRTAWSAAPGSAIIDRNGKILGNVPSAASTREQFDTVTEVYPAVAGQEATPAETRGFGPWKKTTPAQPAIEAQPERRVTRKIPRDSAPGGQSSAVPSRPMRSSAAKSLDAATAKAILDEVGGDKNKARELAKQRGYSF